MDALQLARELGEAIQQDERYVHYALARDASDQDKELQDMISEFNLLRLQLNNELKKQDKDNEKVTETNNKVGALYSKIMANDNMNSYNKAKSELDGLVNQINGIITLSINGEDPATCDPSTCGGGCSSCSGCG